MNILIENQLIPPYVLTFSVSTLFDFTIDNNLSKWTEQSDTVRSVGMSKASFVPFKNANSQRAILFTLLNPQPNGAGFAGVRIFANLDLTGFKAFSMRIRGRGENYGYKIVLRHRNENEEPFPTYEQFFTVILLVFWLVFSDSFSSFRHPKISSMLFHCHLINSNLITEERSWMIPNR